MQLLRTAGWLACVVYSTIPAFWLMIHPRAQRWRESERSPFRILLPAWIVIWIAAAALTAPWRSVALYSTPWSWPPAVLLFAGGIFIYKSAGAHFSWSQLGGLPEIRPRDDRAGSQDQRLITTGIRSRVRHPVYLGHFCEMLAWSTGTGLAVCWLLTAFAIVTGAVMIRLEDAELERRFGAVYRKYRSKVPAVLPRLTTNQNNHEQLSSDGVFIRRETGGEAAWQMAISDLVCLAEYTMSGGPFVDDYILVFAGNDGLYREASFYSEGRDKTIQTLETKLGCNLTLGLVNSTTFASRIIWPKALEGRPLFLEKGVSPEVKRLSASRQL